MTQLSQDLTDLIGSRICHDLISPVGAISNGLELLAMSQEMQGPEVTLIAESVENANARVRFFRIAFGAASPTQMTGASEIRAILADMCRNGRVQINWRAEGDQLRSEVKLMFLLIQCFETAMPWGGTIDIARTGEEWCVHGQADRMQVEPDLWQVLSRPADAAGLDAARVHFALAPIAAASIGRQLRLESHAQEARIRC